MVAEWIACLLTVQEVSRSNPSILPLLYAELAEFSEIHLGKTILPSISMKLISQGIVLKG